MVSHAGVPQELPMAETVSPQPRSSFLQNLFLQILCPSGVRWAWVVTVITLVAGAPAWAQDDRLLTPVVFAPLAGLIGAVDTGVSAFGIPVDLGTRPLISADNVFRNEVVETLDGGALQIEFVDGTIFQLGENARMILNELVFDPVTGEGGLLVNLVEGVLRIISGAIPSENFTVVTPAATIGIRGTDFEVAVDEFGVTAVSVFEGEVEVEPNDDQPGVGPGAAPGVRRAAAIARAGEARGFAP